MERIQIQVTAAQLRTLRRLAEEEGVSTAAVVREAVDTYVARAPHERRRAKLLAAAGFFGCGPDVAREHDRYLGEAFR